MAARLLFSSLSSPARHPSGSALLFLSQSLRLVGKTLLCLPLRSLFHGKRRADSPQKKGETRLLKDVSGTLVPGRGGGGETSVNFAPARKRKAAEGGSLWVTSHCDF